MISRMTSIRPPGDDPLGPHWADAVDLLQPLRLRLDDIEHGLAKRAHKPLAVDRAYPPIMPEPRYSRYLRPWWVAPHAGSSP